MARQRICVIAFKPVRECIHVLRQIEYLAEQYDLDVVGYGQCDASWPELSWHRVPEPTVRSKIAKLAWFAAGRFSPKLYERWYWSARRHALARAVAEASGADAFHANDWESLPIAIAAARRSGARVVFHTHEYAEEERTDSFLWRLLVAPAIRHLMQRYASPAEGGPDAYITVCEPIADRYRRELGVDVAVVFNAPKPVAVPPPSDASAEPGHIRLLHHGYAKRGRGLHRLIEALALADSRFTLDFMLVPDDRGYIEELRALADRRAPGRVAFREPVSPDQIVTVASAYDVGFCVIEPSSYNNLMMLPNKFFEYIQAGLALCVGPSPAMVQLVEQYGVGVVAPDFEPQVVAATLGRLSWAEIRTMKQASRKAAQVLNADVEMGKVVALYQRLLGQPEAVALR